MKYQKTRPTSLDNIIEGGPLFAHSHAVWIFTLFQGNAPG